MRDSRKQANFGGDRVTLDWVNAGFVHGCLQTLGLRIACRRQTTGRNNIEKRPAMDLADRRKLRIRHEKASTKSTTCADDKGFELKSKPTGGPAQPRPVPVKSRVPPLPRRRPRDPYGGYFH
ncbi:hypothetical protein AVEN_92772-1 [Araneus ventricosus]|uniref:Uncharacterized protein n=1 Tax=Araneus ventricosus TaxID=182803 RepID=A0A4Y2FRX8_ARAVE|nr:hypothetical protein AVEN_92772-1 [Araneus ventricosus]